jgi:hypothetical protein
MVFSGLENVHSSWPAIRKFRGSPGNSWSSWHAAGSSGGPPGFEKFKITISNYGEMLDYAWKNHVRYATHG